MQKLIRFSLFTFLFLGVLSTGSMSMDDETPVVVPVQKKMRSVKLQPPRDIDLKRTMQKLEIAEGATPMETKANRAAYMSGYYTLEILKEKRDADGNVKPRTNFGKAGALLDFAAGAYQRKDRAALGKLIRSGRLDEKRINSQTGKSEWVFLNGSYVHVINDALLKLAGAPQLRREQEDDDWARMSSRARKPTEKVGVRLTGAKEPKKKDAGGCDC